MTEPIDLYSDNFTVSIGPYGASLSFGVTVPHPEPSRPEPPQRVATIRMSVEHLKTMAIIITRHVKRMEGELGISYNMPSNILAQLGIGREDWDAFWSK
jgi:hypothetical protein